MTLRRFRAGVLVFGFAAAVLSFVSAPSAEDGGSRLLFVGPTGAEPFLYLENGEPAGISADIASEIGRLLRRPVEIRVFDFREARRKVRDGEADAVMPVPIVPERQQQFDLSFPLFDVVFTVFARENEHFPAGWPNRKGVRVGVFKKGLSVTLARKLYPEATLVTVQGTANAMRLVQHSEIDAMINTRRTGLQVIIDEDISNVVALPITLLKVPSAIAVRKGNQELLQTLNEAIGKLNGEGRIEEIVSDWESTQVLMIPKGRVWFAVTVAAISVAVGILALIAFYVHRLRIANRRLEEDITERKRAEETLRESERRTKEIIANSTAGYFFIDQDGHFREVNDAWLRMHRFSSADEVIGQHFSISQVDEDLEKARKNVAKLMSGDPIPEGEFSRRCRDGTIEYHFFSANPVTVEGKIVGLEGFLLYITERKRAEEEIRNYAELFQKWKTSNFIGIIQSNAEGGIIDANDTLLEMLGYSRQNLIDGNMDWTKWTPPEFLHLDMRALEEAAEKGFWTAFEKEYFHKDGHRVPIIIGGSQYREGPNEYIVFVVDITERKQLEEQVRRSQKMEAVGQLTGGVAHDFNNLLQVVASNVSLAQFELEEGSTASAYLDMIRKAAARGGALTQQLLAFSRKQTLNPITVDPNGLIEGMLKILGRTLGEDIEIETSLEDDISSIIVDTSALENAILNLALNARAAMPEGGELTVASGRKRMDEDFATEDGVLPAGEYVEISLTDSGCGMSPEVLARAIEPFFTTREVGEGSGLGLSMVYGFTEQSGGHLSLESEPTKGTTARIILPVSEEAAEATQEALPKMEAGRGSGTVLVVEDDPDVRATAVVLLKSFGYEVREAQDAVVALEVLQDDAGVNLLFADVVMPKGMNGFQLAEEASRRYPGLRVLLTSGYPETELERAGSRESGFTLLKKPYSQRELTDALKSIVET
jgi:PAS domain S-box-containing protein